MSEFIFCPRCGAVTKPGICTNCGYNTEKEKQSEENFENENSQNAVSSDENISEIQPSAEPSASDSQTEDKTFAKQPASAPAAKKEKKGAAGLIIGLVLGGCLVAFVIVLLVVVLAIGIIPIVIKTTYTVNTNNNPTVTVTNPSTNNNNNLNLPNITNNNEDDPEEKPETDDDGDVETEPEEEYPEYHYASTIEGNYGGTSDFDYKKFEEEIASSANEYWDQKADDSFDYFVNGSYSDYLQTPGSHDFVERDAFPRPYYDNIVDSYIENPNYTVERHLIRYEGEINGIFANAFCSYYTLGSDKADFTAVNEALRNQAISELYEFVNGQNSSASYNYTLYCDSIITFNNDEIFSVVYNTTSYKNNYTDKFFIHGMNVDLKNAQVMENTKILNFDDDFSRFFVTRSNTQNHYLDALNECDVKDITATFNNDDSLILYFTPLGIEVGMNYLYKYSYGWVTVSINNFDKYLSGTYNFNTDFGKGYDIYKYEKDNNITEDTGYTTDYEDLYFDL